MPSCLLPITVCVGSLYLIMIVAGLLNKRPGYPTKAPPGYHFEWGVGLVPNFPRSKKKHYWDTLSAAAE